MMYLYLLIGFFGLVLIIFPLWFDWDRFFPHLEFYLMIMGGLLMGWSARHIDEFKRDRH